MTVSLDKLTTVTKNFSKTGQVCDIRYSQSQEKFFVNDELYTRLDLNNNGFVLHYDAEAGKMYLSIHPNEDAVMYTGHPKSDTKSKNFQSSEFQKYLKIFDWLSQDQDEDLEMDLVAVETDSDLDLFQLVLVDEFEPEATHTEDVADTVEQQEEQLTPNMVDASPGTDATDSEDPFNS